MENLLIYILFPYVSDVFIWNNPNYNEDVIKNSFRISLLIDI